MLSTVFEVRPLKSWFDLANFIVKAIKEPKKIFFPYKLNKTNFASTRLFTC